MTDSEGDHHGTSRRAGLTDTAVQSARRRTPDACRLRSRFVTPQRGRMPCELMTHVERAAGVVRADRRIVQTYRARRAIGRPVLLAPACAGRVLRRPEPPNMRMPIGAGMSGAALP